MSDLFSVDSVNQTWETLSVLKPALLLAYKEQLDAKFFNPERSRLQPEPVEKVAASLERNREWIPYVTEELVHTTADKLLIPHLFIVTDAHGLALDLHYPAQMQRPLERLGLRQGVSFALDKAGVNGIAMAMERRAIAAVRGEEHDLHMFKDWNCVCAPIRQGGSIIGYLDLSYDSSYAVEFAIPLLLQVIERTEARLAANSPEQSKTIMLERLCAHGLTQRESEAAYGWLMSYSATRIASDMGIAEGTVRNLLKKVYAKTKVNDKGQFFRLFANGM